MPAFTGAMPRFDFNLLSALHALLTESNVTKAAQRLGVSQSTMSGMLQRLRYQLGDEILVRRGRGMELTYFGRSLLEPVHDALRDLEALIQPEEDFKPISSTRVFSVMVSDYCEAILLPQVLVRLSELAPGIRLNIHPIDNPTERMLAGEVDMCLLARSVWPLTPREGSEVLDIEHLFSDEFVCIAANDNSISDDLSVSDYVRLNHVGVRFPGGLVSIDERALRERFPDYQISYGVSGFLSMLEIVAASNMLGLVQRRLAERALSRWGLRIFPPPFALPRLHEALLWHRRHTNEPSHRFLRNILIEEAKRIN
ncbi:LysR family transcriptional regulator [Paraburkholderia sp.]|uniref:LysR family transcriptional regulator n=1 Tax=Paraburkholderia sp. TaxID=1926495 RepID=UPI003C7B0E55